MRVVSEYLQGLLGPPCPVALQGSTIIEPNTVDGDTAWARIDEATPPHPGRAVGDDEPQKHTLRSLPECECVPVCLCAQCDLSEVRQRLRSALVAAIWNTHATGVHSSMLEKPASLSEGTHDLRGVLILDPGPCMTAFVSKATRTCRHLPSSLGSGSGLSGRGLG